MVCACGCGQRTKEGNKYVLGHNSRVNHPMKGKTHTEQVRKRLSESHRGIPLSVRHRENIGLAQVGRVGPMKGKVSPFKGRRHSEEAKAKNSEAHKGRRASPGTEFTSEIMKERYSDSAYIEKMKAAWNMKPNREELSLMALLDRLYPGEWKYTGDFSMTINGKCPDFVNCNGQKKIIEYFGDYWHRGHCPGERALAFVPFGYKTLVIWGSEMKNLDGVVGRIHAFMEV